MQRWPALLRTMSSANTHASSSCHKRFTSEEPRTPIKEPWQRQPSPPASGRSEPLIRPSQEYIDLSARTPVISPANAKTPKLLVLDLNGALIYRVKSGGAGRRAAHARPYLSSFLEYLFAPELDGQTRPWEAFVWSSAQPNNVRAMVELGFRKRWTAGLWQRESYEDEREREQSGSGKLLGVWARDKMGLTEHQYHKKTQTTKDLRKVYEHFAPRPEPERWSPSIGSRTPETLTPPPFSELNSLLLDDSPLKAVYQPFNQLVIPEYDQREHRDSIDGIAAFEDGVEAATEVDQILLGVVGILDALKSVDNIPAWVRAGGLFPKAASKSRSASRRSDLDDEDLPSHADYLHWYASPDHLAWWIARGREALEAKGIKPEHGMTLPPRRQSDQERYSPSRSLRQYPRGDSPAWRQSSEHHHNGESSSSRGGRAALVPLGAALAGINGHKTEEDEETIPPLHLAVQAATDTIHRVLSSLPSLQREPVQALLDACDLLSDLCPLEPIEDRQDDAMWCDEAERVQAVGHAWMQRRANTVEPPATQPAQPAQTPPQASETSKSKIRSPKGAQVEAQGHRKAEKKAKRRERRQEALQSHLKASKRLRKK